MTAIETTASPRRWLAPLLPLLILSGVLALLHRALADHPLHEILNPLRAMPAGVMALSMAATLASYLTLTGYDLLALRYVGQKVRALRAMLTSFIAFAVGHNVGLATLTGAAIRLRLYGSAGVAATHIALMSGFCVLTTVLGAWALLAYSFLSEPAAAAVMLRLPAPVPAILGGAAALGLLAYLFWTSHRRKPLVWRHWSLALPPPAIGLMQIAVAALDLCLAAAALYVLLPTHAMSYPAFLAAYVLATVLAMASNVPGGLGVFESAMLLALPQLPTTGLLAALLAYRLVYYLLPLVLAAALLAAHEAWLHRHRVLAVAGVARDWLSAVAPQVLGVVVIVAGCVLLLSGATPGIDARLRELPGFVPLPVLELSHLLGSVAGLGLLILSHALFRRVRLASQLVLALLLAGAVFSLLKGWDYEEASLMLGVAGLLFASKSAFYRRAALLKSRFDAPWLMGLAVILGVVIWVGLLAHRHVEYSNELWWTFAWSGDAPRMLRAAFAVGLLAAAFVIFNALSPHRPEPQPADAAALEHAKPIVTTARRAAANLALLGDKRLLLHPQGNAFLMYQVAGRSWVAMGDPVVSTAGDAAQATDLAWKFRELVDEHGGWTVFYQVTPEYLPVYIDLGLALLKLGEEARVPLPEFTLEGSRRAELRSVRRRAQREAATFEVLEAPLAAALMSELRAISQDWLSSKAAHEKRFSVGFFDEAYLGNFPFALVRVQGRPVAFANLWTMASRAELSIDLMRYSSAAPPAVMDFLLIETLLWGKAEGYQCFNLGMAPLSGLEQRPLAPVWHRAGNLLSDIGGHFYNFEGLRRYKEKFCPVWEPRYLAAPGGLALPRVLIDVMSLIAGGLKEIVSK